ncbi:SpoIIE family protein phosphatase [Tundrisphaera sp. TA3]|uniref:SpoIIE family protein phosphatase n=1 Tax=Tundrisphaera sp. TA3 TaxID=3435775 RepID=UPI003EBCD08E
MPDASPVAPTIELISTYLPRRLFEMTKDQVRIGRDPGSDIFLNRKDVSWSHARIFRRDGGFFVEDRESRNATYLDGERLSPHHPRRLDDNHRIRICGNILVYRREAVRIETEENGSTILGTLGNLTSLDIVSSVARPEDVLRAVLEINRNLGGTIELDEALGRTLGTLFEVFDEAEGGFILTGEPGSNMVQRAIRHRDGDAPLSLSLSARDHAIRQGQGLICTEDGSDGLSRTILCVPLLARSGLSIGIIQLSSRPGGPGFRADDLDLLAAVAVPVGVAVENHRLLWNKGEWAAAGEVQRALLPRHRPRSDRYTTWEHYEPAQEVGGDYYDYIPIEPAEADGRHEWTRWGVAVGDVVGKGMSAALLMSHLSSEVRHRVRAEASPELVVAGLNRHLFDAEILDRFVTFLLIVVDAPKDRILIVNAGHPAPMIRRANGRIEVVGDEDAGPPLGVVIDHPYRITTVGLDPGDVVVAYTDGVSEAINAHDRLFGVEAIRATLAQSPPGVQAIGRSILKAVRVHALGHPQSDDIAIVCFGRDA